jgi:hypothetical protein
MYPYCLSHHHCRWLLQRSKKEPGVLRRVSLSDNSRINANDGMVTFKMLCLNPRAQKNKKGPSEIIFLVGFKIGFLGTWRAPIAFGK